MSDVLAEYRSSNPTLYAFARHAMAEALRRTGVKAGDLVALPELICRDVLASLHAVGAQPVFYAVDASLKPTGLDLLAPAKAIIAVDYFGFPQDLEPFRAYCSKANAALIEDNAHGLFSRDSEGRLLGTRADYGVISLRKTFHVATGAVLLSRNPGGAEPPCSSRSEGSHGLRYVFSRLERRTGIPVFLLFRFGIRILRRILRRDPIDLGSPSDEVNLPDQVSIGCKSLIRLNRQDPHTESERRRETFSEIVRALSNEPDVELIHERLDDKVVPYGIPFRIKGSPSSVLRRIERRHHVVVMQWPSLPSAVTTTAPDHYRNVWLVNLL